MVVEAEWLDGLLGELRRRLIAVVILEFHCSSEYVRNSLPIINGGVRITGPRPRS